MKSRKALLTVASTSVLASGLLFSAHLSAAQHLKTTAQSLATTVTLHQEKCEEGKCGEGKCGEGKCGEGKCGQGKCK